MQRQQHSTHDGIARFAVITDSAADIPDEEMERLDIHMVPCRIQFGDRGYLDKVSISSTEFFDELASNPVAPTTSQPSPGDFRRHFQYLASHFPDVISINLTPRVSGTLQAARSAAARTNASGKVHVVNSQNASLGQGLLAVFAAECATAGLDIETAMAAIEKMIPVTTSFALIRDLRYAVRGGRIPASRKIIADWLRLTPVIRTEADGSVSASGILPGRKNLLPKFARYVARNCNPDTELHLAIGHAVCSDDACNLRELLHGRLPNIRKSSITGLGSALGAHGGPGSLVVGVQEYRDPETFS
jgi:DegV family protein with EDD domain